MTSARGRRGSETDLLPEAVEIIDVEKRKGLSKYYAYVVQVTLKNGESYTVFRRFREFNDLNQKLEDRFPVEAGYFNYAERKLPELPKKIYLGRSSVRNVAEERQPYLNYYLQHLLTLGNGIKYDSIVLSFLRENPKDTLAAEKRVAAGLDSPPQQISPTTRTKPVRTLACGRNGNVSQFNTSGSGFTSSGSGFTSSGSHSGGPPGGRPPQLPPPPGGGARPSGPPPPRPVKKPSFSVPPKPSKPSIPPPTWGKPPVASKPGAAKKPPFGRPPPPAGVARVKGFRPRVSSYILDVEDDKTGESDEWDEDEAKGKITFYYKGIARELEVESELIQKPSFMKIKLAIEDAMPYGQVVLNFKDKDGDLVQLNDESDMKLLTKYATMKRFQKDPLKAKWSIYITKVGDYSVYNTHPYETK